MLLVTSQQYQQVSNDTVCEFENILCQSKEVKLASSYSESHYKFLYFFVRIFRKLKINPIVLTKYKKKPLEDKKHLFSIMMALDKYKFKPYLLNSFHNKSVYLFDAWPKDYIKIQNFCKTYRINYLFVSSSLSSIRLRKLLPTTIDGLARTKISIYFPSDLTHPEKAGDVSTMTVRYLQSMVVKCLIVGHAPQKMVDLFGYNPVVEADFTRPAEQLIEILNHYEDYFPFIERNYQEVIEHHNWQCRWNQLKEIYQQHTFL